MTRKLVLTHCHHRLQSHPQRLIANEFLLPANLPHQGVGADRRLASVPKTIEVVKISFPQGMF